MATGSSPERSACPRQGAVLWLDRGRRLSGPLSRPHWNVRTGVGAPAALCVRTRRGSAKPADSQARPGPAQPRAVREAASRASGLWLRGPPRPKTPLLPSLPPSLAPLGPAGQQRQTVRAVGL